MLRRKKISKPPGTPTKKPSGVPKVVKPTENNKKKGW